MPGVPRELVEHRLEVNKTTRPIKQKLRRFAKDRKQDIEVEVIKLLAAGFIRECQHPIWLANPVLVPNKTGGLRMCIDYTELNKHCPKDPFPLPRIDQVVDSTAGSVLLCFLDCYLGYHQIALHLDDKDKTAFITPHGIYCYKVMTFGKRRSNLPEGNPEVLEDPNCEERQSLCGRCGRQHYRGRQAHHRPHGNLR
jgi:hypothetical protein